MKAAPAILLLVLAGCGEDQNRAVRGEVVFPNGKPMAGGAIEIELAAADVRDRKNAHAEIQPDGSFPLRAPEGNYRVIVRPPLVIKDGVAVKDPNRLHPRFSRYDTSNLRLTVSRDNAKNQVKLLVASE